MSLHPDTPRPNRERGTGACEHTHTLTYPRPSMPRLRCANAPTTAGLFVQLSMRRQAAVSGGLPILDLLLPFPRRSVGAPSIRAHHVASAGRAASSAFASRAPNSRPWRATASHSILPICRATPLNSPARAFSTSHPWRATHAIFNPQVDDDGKEMILEITPRAADVCYPPSTLPSPQETANHQPRHSASPR